MYVRSGESQRQSRVHRDRWPQWYQHHNHHNDLSSQSASFSAHHKVDQLPHNDFAAEPEDMVASVSNIRQDADIEELYAVRHG